LYKIILGTEIYHASCSGGHIARRHLLPTRSTPHRLDSDNTVFILTSPLQNRKVLYPLTLMRAI